MADAAIPLAPDPPTRSDRLGLADAMILIAAIAFGLFWLRREYPVADFGWTFATPGVVSRLMAGLMTACSWFGVIVPLAGSLTLGLALVQLRRPGLFSGSLFGRPGLLACLSASVPIVLYLAQRSIAAVVESAVRLASATRFVPGAHGKYFEATGPLDQLASSAGVAVLATRLISRLGPARGASGGLLDRAGRWLGIYWIATVAFRIVVDTLWPLCLEGLI